MADTYRCDLCGEQGDPATKSDLVLVLPNQDQYRADLCPPCAQAAVRVCGFFTRYTFREWVFAGLVDPLLGCFGQQRRLRRLRDD